jgi:hypothetical protein
VAESDDIDEALRSYELKRRTRLNNVRGAVRHRAILQGMEGQSRQNWSHGIRRFFPTPRRFITVWSKSSSQQPDAADPDVRDAIEKIPKPPLT